MKKNKRKGTAKKVIAWILSLAIIGTAVGGIFAYNKNEKFKSKVNDILKIEQSVEQSKEESSTGDTTSSADAAELANLKQQLSKAETEVDNLEIKLTSANTNIATLEAEIAELEAQLETAGEEKEDLEAQLETKTQALAAAQAEKTSLETQLASANETIETLEAEKLLLEQELANAGNKRTYVNLSAEKVNFRTNNMCVNGEDLWTDGKDLFYSYYYGDTSLQLVYDENNNSWEKKFGLVFPILMLLTFGQMKKIFIILSKQHIIF